MSVITQASIESDLRTLGLSAGDVVLAHISMSSLGTVVGSEQAVISALLAVLGDSGTLVMPAQSWQLCDPNYLDDPKLSQSDRELVRDNLPVYDLALTPSKSMGRVAELFRTLPGVVRSAHPHRSFAALGPDAAELMMVHDLDSPNGERSPLKALYDRDAYTLLLGVGYDKSTALHLAEHRSGTISNLISNGAPLLVDGARQWVEFEEVEVFDDDFAELGAAFSQHSGLVREGKVGVADALLMRQQALIDFASNWFQLNRR